MKYMDKEYIKTYLEVFSDDLKELGVISAHYEDILSYELADIKHHFEEIKELLKNKIK